MHSLTPSEAVLAADGLADIPENCIARHALRSGRGRAFMLDGAESRRALVIDPSVTPGELLAFGDNLPAIGELLGGLRGWNVVEVAPAMADELAERLAAGSHATIDRMRDLYFTLNTSPAPFEHPSVRQLTRDDLDLYVRSAPALHRDPQEAKLTLLEGPVIAAVVEDRVVCTVELNVRTERYANFTVETVPDCRKQGLCTATASFAAWWRSRWD